MENRVVVQAGPMDADTYHADPAPEPSLSSGLANLIVNRSPAHAWQAAARLNADYREVQREDFDLGSAAHALLLEGEDRMEVLQFEDWRTKAAREARDEARANGKLPTLARHAARIHAMAAEAQKALKAFGQPLQEFEPEFTVIWKADGIYKRARMDLLHKTEALIIDYKTTESAHPLAFSRRMVGMGYDIQAAHYSEALTAHRYTGVQPTFLFLVQETQPPYECSIVGADPSLLALGYAKTEKASRTWRECLASKVWPGYGLQVYWAEAPAWAQAEWEERTMAFPVPQVEEDTYRLYGARDGV